MLRDLKIQTLTGNLKLKALGLDMDLDKAL